MSYSITLNKTKYVDQSDEGNKLMSVSGFVGDSLPAVSLPVDTLSVRVRNYDTQIRLLSCEGYPMASSEGALLVSCVSDKRLDQICKYGDDVTCHHNENLIGKFKLEKVKRTGRYEYHMDCISAIGLLLTSNHYGGIYTGETAREVIADIIGGIVGYTIDASLSEVKLFGLLRKRTRRDNLRDVLFAIGGQIRKDTLGEIHIVPTEEREPYEIKTDDFYVGGSVTGDNPATAVNVTEHSFSALDSDVVTTLYEGESAAEQMVTPCGKTVVGVLVDFKEPMHDLTIQNAEILESGANYAVISGSPAALLTGKQYTHTERIITRQGNTNGIPNVVVSKSCELVNLMNSEMVADRLWGYYSAATTVEADMVVNRQKPGDAVSFVDPFGDSVTGYISDMELSMSAIMKAKATLVTGFIPSAWGNYYNNVLIITESGTVTIPDTCKGKARIVLIGGGAGGTAGNPGETGISGDFDGPGRSGGAGGLPGMPGKGGNVFVGTIPVSPGQKISATVGKGGVGQTSDSEATPGEESTFGQYTSADGFSSDVGYANLITGDVYALPGEEGIAGGKGSGADGVGENIVFNGVTYTPGADGADVDGYVSGKAFGGFGGGAAAGANGADGGDGGTERNNGNGFNSAGPGGRGATPVNGIDGIVPGQGGGAGHGGGGGGGGGTATGPTDGSGGRYYNPFGQGGLGGLGSDGGDGANGIILIFY